MARDSRAGRPNVLRPPPPVHPPVTPTEGPSADAEIMKELRALRAAAEATKSNTSFSAGRVLLLLVLIILLALFFVANRSIFS